MKKDYLFLGITVSVILVLSCGSHFWNTTLADQIEISQLFSKTEKGPSDSDPEKQETADEKTKTGTDNTPTLFSLLKNAALARDQVLYVWGGGWNEEDTGGNEEANSMGLSQSWLDFYQTSLDGYNYADHPWEIHSGLDCSGYVGWVLFNTLQDGKDHVVLADQFDEVLSEQGLGTRKSAAEVTEILPGDIMTSADHIYIALGQYDDGSVLLIHSSPPGVKISGTSGKAYEAAQNCQTNGWDASADSSYLHYDQFRFSQSVLPDPEQVQSMNPDGILDLLLNTDS